MKPASGAVVASLLVVCSIELVAIATAAVERRSPYQRIDYAGDHIHVGDFRPPSAGAAASKQHRRQQQHEQQQRWRQNPSYSTTTSTSGSAAFDNVTSPTPPDARRAPLSAAAGCPVEPPCFCTDRAPVLSPSTTTSARHPTGSASSTSGSQRRTAVVSQRITCGVFGMTSSASSSSSAPTNGSRRRKQHGGRKRVGGGGVDDVTGSSRRRAAASSSSRRFPRFVESNDAVERQVSLSYSGLTTIPGAAFHAIKVRTSVELFSSIFSNDIKTIIAYRVNESNMS